MIIILIDKVNNRHWKTNFLLIQLKKFHMIINIDLKDAVTLTTCIAKDNDQFYLQLFLEEALILQTWFELVKVGRR